MENSVNQPGLKALLGTDSTETFLTNDWPRDPFVAHGRAADLRPLMSLPFLASLDALFMSWPMSIQAHLPDYADEVSSVDATSKDARKLFSNKMSLLFNNAQMISPVLQEWLEAFRVDLGLPQSTIARCMIYATPNGKGTAAHFDQNVNFVLQLHGTKKWRLSPNLSVENPTQRHTIGQPMDPELASYAYEEMPDAQPSGGIEVELKPGSVLFVPRGYWHSTQAEGEALALNFTFNQPTWVDLFTLALRSRLLLHPGWRELADGVSSADLSRRALGEEKLDALLMELVGDLPHWRAADILGSTEGF